MAVVIMGVSGAGKSTIGQKLAHAMNCTFLDADDFHSQSNKEKMQKGIALTEEDRAPWLEALKGALRKNLDGNQPVVLGCSALKQGYREVLRGADRSYKLGSFKSMVNFVLLDANAEILEDRLRKRFEEGKHFMPVTLLKSQLDTLQIEETEDILRVYATLQPEAIVDTILASDKLEQITWGNLN